MKFLEATHGQWLYQNLHMNNAVTGVMATDCKEKIQHFIEDQLDMGEKGSDTQDHYLLEINLEDLETSSGKEQHYWLLQIKAAGCDCELRESGLNNNNSHNEQG